MEFGGVMSRVNIACDWVMKLAIANLLWLGFTLLGLVVLGAAPATAALFSIVRKWIMGEKDIPIFKTFWQHYRKDFIQSNMLGLLFFVIGFVLYVDFRFVLNYEGMWSIVLLIMVAAVCAAYLLTAVYLFPVYVHFESPGLKGCIKNAFLIGISQLPSTLLMIGGIFLSFLLFKFLPGSLLFYSASLISFFLYHSAHRVFLKIDRAKNVEEIEA
ncbi:YesL family protein [Virgibacillus siamensis]|uniref:YesL family protein n=1 Tax=Virgibacillus siamensis TaxID=480071 RepID=UPI000986B0C8|nr:YesL family protein [Virgibacillus siamensis]